VWKNEVEKAQILLK